MTTRLQLVPIGADDPAWCGLTEADLWPGKPCREEREADRYEHLAVSEDVQEAALAYAQFGWHVHPCRPREKLPILDKWPNRATTSVEMIRRWFSRTPAANIAVATGPKSGVMVVDVDGDLGEAALARLERTHSALPELTPLQITGGGLQLFLAWPSDRDIRNSAGRLGPKLDTRGGGGYVVLPPSIHPNGKRYRWAEGRSPWEVPIAYPPAWLLDLLDPPPAPTKPAGSNFRPSKQTTGPDRYALKALEAELALVALAPEGARNDQVWSSAKSLFRLVAQGRLPASVTRDGLLDAARHNGCGADRGCREKCRRFCRAEDAIKRAAAKRGVGL